MKSFSALAAALALVAACASVAAALPPIRHVVVLMQENRSFDHLMGFLKRVNPEIQGLVGNETNPYDPKNLSLGYVTVSDDSGYVTEPDPGHEVDDVIEQCYGSLDPADQDQSPMPMNGFVYNYMRAIGAPNGGSDVMRCFNPDDLPVSTELALQFGIIDEWFCSVPGYYLISASSHGVSGNTARDVIVGQPQKTLFTSFEEAGLRWASYFGEIPTPLMFKDTRQVEGNFHHMSMFAEHAAQGLLPELTLIDPIYFGLPILGPANDDHPDHDVSLGQKLMKDVYEALRASPHWEETLLIITYDEHGGFYDHFSVPVDVPNPDGLVSPEFDFTRLGPRVPALFISPWIDAGTLVHRPSGPFPGSSQFDHASVAATMKLLFNLTSFLTARDAWAGTFEGVFSPTRTTPRQDCPVTLPEPKPLANFVPPTGREPLSGLQRDLVALAAGLHGIEAVDTSNMTVTEGLRLVQRLVNRHFKRNMYPAHLLAADEVGPAEF